MKLYIFILFILATIQCSGQAGAGMVLGHNDKHYKDSLRRAGYPYRFPIWGGKAVQKGFNLQYPVGEMLNISGGTQDITISDLKVGFNDQEPVALDFIKFGKVQANMQSITSCLDLWVLPFLDIYGILGLVQAKTAININAPFQFSSETKFKGYTMGLGTTLAAGYHGIITISNINYTWTHMDKLDEVVKTLILTPRVGYNIPLKGHVNKSFAIWIGATGFYVNQGTKGSINLSDLTPEMSEEEINKIIAETDDWYKSLSKPQQVVVKGIAEAIKKRLDGLPDDITVHYSLKKSPTSKWSMLAGAQFQFSKRWQVRAETGFLGGRSSLLLSGNYRWKW